MKPISILIAISLVLIVAVVLFLWSRPRRPAIKSFWDLVRHPELMPSLDELEHEADEGASSLSGSPAKVAQLVDYVVFEATSERDAAAEFQILARLGEEAYPRALEILGDPALTDQLKQVTEHDNALPEAPINRLCQLFDQESPPPKEAAPLLARFLGAESKEIRKSVALIIGSIGSDEALSHLRRALADEDEYVRSYALIGIERAIAGDRIEASQKGAYYSLVASLWPADPQSDIAAIILKLDRQRAIAFLLDEQLFSVNFRPVWRILAALNQESVAIPRERLLQLIAAADQEPLKYPLDSILEEALPLLGSHRAAADLPLLERFLDHENEDVSRGAIVALYRFHQYYVRIRNPWDVVEEHGWGRLPKLRSTFVR